MMWFFAILIVLAFAGVAAVAVGGGAPLADAVDERPGALAPGAGPITTADLRRVRFPVVFRGYRMSDVDALLDRLVDQLGEPAQSGEDPQP